MSQVRRIAHCVALVGIILLALFLRSYGLATTPPALTYDEAQNGLDALRVLQTDYHPLHFEANSGREPLFIYLQAGLVGLLGANPFTLRLAAVIVGVLTVPAAYVCLKAILAPAEGWRTASRVALLATLWLSISYYHLHFSRMGLRMIALPLVTTLAFYFLWRGLGRGERTSFFLAGFALAATLYTYLAARFVPLIVLFALPLLVQRFRVSWQPFGMLALGFGPAILPLAIYFQQQPQNFLWRARQVAVINQENPVRLLVQNVARTLLMFNLRGDDVYPLNNLPGRPVFDLLTGLLFLVGLGLALKRLGDARRRGSYAFLLLWPSIMLLPSILSVPAPHFYRTIGILPVIFVFPALAAQALIARQPHRRWVVTLAVAAVLIMSLVSTFHDYFDRWAPSRETYYAFDGDEADLASYLRRQIASAEIYLAPIWRDHATIAFFTRDLPLKSFDAMRAMVFPVGGGRDALYVFPSWDAPSFARIQRYTAGLAQPEEVRDKWGRVIATAYRIPAEALEPQTFEARAGAHSRPHQPLMADFNGELSLLGYSIEQTRTLDITLFWRAGQPQDDYTVFLHLLGPLGERWGQQDAPPGGGSYPTTAWTKGELILDRHPLPLQPGAPPGEYRLLVGLYTWPDLRRLPVQRDGQVSQAISLWPVSLPKPRPLELTETTPAHPLEQSVTRALKLRGYDLSRDVVPTGEQVRVTLYWEVQADPSMDYQVVLALRDGNGRRWGRLIEPPLAGTYPTTRWQPGQLWADVHYLTVPAELASGTYRLEVGLVGPSEAEVTAVELGELQVKAVPRRFDPPPIAYPLVADLGEQVRFLGYAVEPQTLKAGGELHLTLYWQARAPMDVSYKVFTHLLDAGASMWGQVDAFPVNGTRPTTGWLPGEIIVDRYQIPIDPAAPPGEYFVELGMYDPDTLERLPVVIDGQRLPQNRILLKHIQVVP